MTVSLSPAMAAEPPLVRSKQSGAWSSPDHLGRGPNSPRGRRPSHRPCGASRLLRRRVPRDHPARADRRRHSISLATGTRRLDAGLITVTTSEEPSEEGYDCHADSKAPEDGKARARADHRPAGCAAIPAKFTATIRLRHVEGMDKASCPALVCCGGHWSSTASLWPGPG